MKKNKYFTLFCEQIEIVYEYFRNTNLNKIHKNVSLQAMNIKMFPFSYAIHLRLCDRMHIEQHNFEKMVCPKMSGWGTGIDNVFKKEMPQNYKIAILNTMR